MDLLQTMGRFKLEREHAQGAAGTVYSAWDPSTGARVAVKVIRGLGTEELARFQREALTLARVEHPCVVRYVDHGVLPHGAAYLVMEWLDGEDLKSLLARRALGWQEALRMGLRVTRALAAVHEQRLVHRDVKPANIFLPEQKPHEAKLIDFGLIRSTDLGGEASVTRTGVAVGTPSYMAPEQARGGRGVDERADLFSLGCVLYRCLAGRPPFEGKHVVAILTKVLLEAPDSLRELRPDVPPAFAAAVMRMLEKEPEKRFQTAEEALRALAAVPLPDERPEGVGLAPSPSEPGNEKAVSSTSVTAGEQRFGAILMIGGARLEDTESGIRALVTAHHGRCDLLLDGTLVATFAGGGSIRDHAVQAAMCALALRDALPGASMALASGLAEVGRPEGSAIDRAASLLADLGRSAADGAPLSAPARIAVDARAAPLLDARFELEEAGELLFLGAARRVETPVRTLLGRPTPMVGRDWELGAIEQLVRDSAEEGDVRGILVLGEPGMGKSRIAHEARARLRSTFPDVEIWWGQGDSFRSESALFVLGQILRGAAGAHESQPPSARWRQLSQLVHRRLPDPRDHWVAEILGDVAGAPPVGEEPSLALRSARGDPQVMSTRIEEAWQRLVDASCARGPLVLMINDLHWVDVATQRLLRSTIRPLARQPLCVVGLARPELSTAPPRLWEQAELQRIRLRPLPRKASRDLARAVLGDSVDPGTFERLTAVADGNAFYLEELIRTVAEARSAGAPDAPLPDTVLGMAQARLLGLDQETRRILRAASVFGEVFWAGGVAALAGDTLPTSGVDALLAAELVTQAPESRFAGERELCFRHALLREAAYATLTGVDRTRSHALAAEWLAAHGETDPMVLAHHWEMAGRPERAADLLLDAATRAVAGADLDEGILLAERALPHLSAPERKIACLGLLADAYVWHQDWDKAFSTSETLAALAVPGTEPWFRAMAPRLGAAFSTGRVDMMFEILRAVMAAEVAPSSEPLAMSIIAAVLLVLCLGGQLALARTAVLRMDQLLAAAGPDDAHAAAWASLGRTLYHLWVDGNPWAARRAARHATSYFEAVRNLRYERVARTFAGLAAAELGLVEEAEQQLRAVRPDEKDPVTTLLARLYLAFALIDRGEVEEARAIADERRAIAHDSNPTLAARRVAEGTWIHGEIAALEGPGRDLEKARALLAECLPGLRMTPLQRQRAQARLCEVLLSLGRAEEALSLAEEAWEITGSQGAGGPRPAWVHLVLAEARRANGRTEEAHRALREALRLAEQRTAAIDDPGVRLRCSNRPENARARARAEEWGLSAAADPAPP